MPLTSVSQRHLLLDRYRSPEGQRESGISHLWHLERLARARLGPDRGIHGAADVDFHDPDFISDDQLRAVALSLDCQARRKHSEAAALRAANLVVMDHLVRATDDDERRRRHMNLFPQTHTEKVEMERLADQHQQRDRDRDRRFRQLGSENQAMLQRLQSARSELPRTAELNAWYRHKHSPRVQDMSRFHKAEPFAGARVLESECGVRLPASVTTRPARLAASTNVPARAPFSADPPDARLYDILNDARPPLLERQPPPPLMVRDVLPWVPAALQPPHDATHYGASLRQPPAATLSGRETGLVGGVRPRDTTTLPERSGLGPQARLLREARPPWQPIAAVDVPLYHYAQDLALRPQTDAPAYAATEESGCATLWRHAARHQRESYEAQRKQEEIALSTLRARQETQRASLRAKVRESSCLVAPTSPPRKSSAARTASFQSPVRGSSISSRAPLAVPREHTTTRQSFANTTPSPPTPMPPPSYLSRLPAGDRHDVDRVAAPAPDLENGEDGVATDEALSALLSQWRTALDANDNKPYATL